MESPLQYDNIMYAYHKYVDVSKDSKLGVNSLQKAIEAHFPVFVSEWGISYGDLDDSNIKDWEDPALIFDKAYEFVEGMERNNISWCGWSLSNKAEAYSMILKSCDKLSGWTKEDMTPSGWLMMQALKREE